MLKTRTTTAGVGTSTEVESMRAGVQAAEQAVEQLGNAACDFVIAFGGMGYDHGKMLQGVRSVTGDVPLAGCSAQGVVAQSWAKESPRVAGVMAIASDGLTLTHSMHEGLSRDSYDVGRKISKDLLASPPDEPALLLCLYDPLTGVNVDQLLRGLESERHIPIIGGAASQPWGPLKETRQYMDDRVVQDAATCVLISGDMAAEFGVTHGAVPLGMEATITKAKGNVIYEIDDRPAYSAWKEQTGSGESFSTNDISMWAIGIRLPENIQGDYEGCVTRTLFKFDPEQESIWLQSEIPEGTRVLLHHRTFEAVKDRAVAMAERLKDGIGGRAPLFALSFECGARSSPFLGIDGAAEEVRKVQETVGGDIPWLGMYAWGEIAPLGGVNYFHNYTFPMCVVLPRDEAGPR
jgi:hypothetical protein